MESPRIRIIKPNEREPQPDAKVDEEAFDESTQQQRKAATKIGQWVKEWRKQKLKDAQITRRVVLKTKAVIGRLATLKVDE
jgi:hypothetical protein